jgi:hypothetical protein
MLRDRNRSGKKEPLPIPEGAVKRQPLHVAIDFAALKHLAQVFGRVIWNNQPLIVLEPREPFHSPCWNYSAFDAAICRAGVLQFARPLTHADLARVPGEAELRQRSAPWVLETQVSAGVISRTDLWIDDFNPVHS